MKILISNDDGINAPGLKALVDEFSKDNEIFIVAPNIERSGAGHSITLRKKIKVNKVDYPNAKVPYALEGTPTDCVCYGLNYILKEKPDAIISGINAGPNLAVDCISSGTVGAALEGMINGYPSLAISLANPTNGNYSYVASITKKIFDNYMKEEDKHLYTLNVNVPYEEKEKIKGIKVTKFDGIRLYDTKHIIEGNEESMMIDVKWNGLFIDSKMNKDLDFDVYASDNGYITLSPITYDLVLHNKLSSLKDFEDINL